MPPCLALRDPACRDGAAETASPRWRCRPRLRQRHPAPASRVRCRHWNLPRPVCPAAPPATTAARRARLKGALPALESAPTCLPRRASGNDSGSPRPPQGRAGKAGIGRLSPVLLYQRRIILLFSFFAARYGGAQQDSHYNFCRTFLSLLCRVCHDPLAPHPPMHFACKRTAKPVIFRGERRWRLDYR